MIYKELRCKNRFCEIINDKGTKKIKEYLASLCLSVNNIVHKKSLTKQASLIISLICFRSQGK